MSNPSHVCLGPRAFTQITFDFGLPAPPDIPNTACLILWGGNPEVTNKGQALQIEAMRARGGKLIVIDPRVTDYARAADIHAQPRPGTDGALALGILHHIVAENLYDAEFVENWTRGFDKLRVHLQGYPPGRVTEITGVPAQTIRDIAELYATTRPACISPRNALDEHTNAACAIRAIDFMMALTGNLDVKGGNVFLVPLSLAFNDLKLAEKLPPQMAGKRLGADRVLYARMSQFYPSAHTPTLWNAIAEAKPYPVRALLVFAANPLMTHANARLIERALESLDFLVVSDLFMTATARQADIVLPACTFLERTRFVTYDSHTDHGWNVPPRVELSPRVITPLHVPAVVGLPPDFVFLHSRAFLWPLDRAGRLRFRTGHRGRATGRSVQGAQQSFLSASGDVREGPVSPLSVGLVRQLQSAGVEPARDRMAASPGFEDQAPHRGTIPSRLIARSNDAPRFRNVKRDRPGRGECSQRDQRTQESQWRPYGPRRHRQR